MAYPSRLLGVLGVTLNTRCGWSACGLRVRACHMKGVARMESDVTRLQVETSDMVALLDRRALNFTIPVRAIVFVGASSKLQAVQHNVMPFTITCINIAQLTCHYLVLFRLVIPKMCRIGMPMLGNELVIWHQMRHKYTFEGGSIYILLHTPTSSGLSRHAAAHMPRRLKVTCKPHNSLNQHASRECEL